MPALWRINFVIVACRLKKEMAARVNQVVAEFRKASDRQMVDTAKRTIRENVAISAQLSKISDKTVQLIANSDSLKERERRQRQEIELLQSSETLLTEKNLANQKVFVIVQFQLFCSDFPRTFVTFKRRLKTRLFT